MNYKDLLFLSKIHSVVALLRSTNEFPEAILISFESLQESMVYSAPETLFMINNRFGHLCMKYEQTLIQYDVADKVHQIMSH